MTLPVVLRVVEYFFRFRPEVCFSRFGRSGAACGVFLDGVDCEARAAVLGFCGRVDVRALDRCFCAVVFSRTDVDSELPSDGLCC